MLKKFVQTKRSVGAGKIRNHLENTIQNLLTAILMIINQTGPVFGATTGFGIGIRHPGVTVDGINNDLI